MTACPGDSRTPTKSFNVPVEDSEQVERHNFPDKRKPKQSSANPGLVSETSGFGKTISRVKCPRVQVARLKQWYGPMRLIREVDCQCEDVVFCHRGQVADKLRSSDTENASGLKKIINGDVKRRVVIQEEPAQKEKRFLTGRQVVWMIYQYFKGLRHRRIRLGPQ